MIVIRISGLMVVACALLAPPVAAQVSSSPDYQLVDFVLDSGGGGASSPDYAAHVSLGDVSGGQLDSDRFNSGLGILETSDPEPTNSPVFFGITPDFGPKAGGTVVTVSGVNFDKFGTGPTVTLDVGGLLATGVTVLTDTQLQATVPAGAKGPASVTVTSALGSDSVADAYTYTPAVRTTPQATQGGSIQLRNYGPQGDLFNTYVSTVPTSGNTKYGTLLIGLPLFQLLPTLPYPGPDGISSLQLDVPHDPVLMGLTVYFQSLDIQGFGPLVGELTNRSSTTVQ